MVSMRSAPLLFAWFVCLALTAVAAAQPAPREQHFMEFRARGGAHLGHTYIVYGRIDGNGRILQSTHAGLYPDQAFEDSPILAVALVRGYVTHRRENPNTPVLAAYRRKLSAAEYAHLERTIARLKATSHLWHMWFHNCNDFAAEVAREMGMIAPHPWMLPSVYVNSLRAINGMPR